MALLNVLIHIVHAIVCLFLILVVLLQSGKSGDIASAFGGAGSQTVFGPRGTTTVLSKLTRWSAIGFMVTSMALVLLGQGISSSGSVVGDKGAPAPQSAPAAPQQAPTPAPQPTPGK